MAEKLMVKQKEGTLQGLANNMGDWLKANWENVVLVAGAGVLAEGFGVADFVKDDTFHQSFVDAGIGIEDPIIDFVSDTGKFHIIPEFHNPLDPGWDDVNNDYINDNDPNSQPDFMQADANHDGKIDAGQFAGKFIDLGGDGIADTTVGVDRVTPVKVDLGNPASNVAYTQLKADPFNQVVDQTEWNAYVAAHQPAPAGK